MSTPIIIEEINNQKDHSRPWIIHRNKGKHKLSLTLSWYHNRSKFEDTIKGKESTVVMHSFESESKLKSWALHTPLPRRILAHFAKNWQNSKKYQTWKEQQLYEERQSMNFLTRNSTFDNSKNWVQNYPLGKEWKLIQGNEKGMGRIWP